MTQQTPPPRPRHRRDAFTLIELMISLALVLLLVLAMTRIFAVTTRAISKGSATGEVVRNLEAARTSLTVDLAGTTRLGTGKLSASGGILPLSEQPAIIISSKAYRTFLSEAAREADNDDLPETVDLDGDGTDETTLSVFDTGRGFFRGDRLSFFAEGDFESQALENVTSPEAWVWYGHGRVYNGQGDLSVAANYKGLTEGPSAENPNNFYASDWLLLRNPVLLKPEVDHDGLPATAATVVNDLDQPIPHLSTRRTGGGQTPWSAEAPADRFTLVTETGAVNSEASVSPLAYRNQAYRFGPAPGSPSPRTWLFRRDPSLTAPQNATNPAYEIQDSRVDVAGVTAQPFREHIEAIQKVNPADYSNPDQFNLLDAKFYPFKTPNVRRTWFGQLFATEAGEQNRFWVNPQIVTPLDPTETSQATAFLGRGTTQFIVEFAGDFMRQDALGRPDHIDVDNDGSVDVVPDGVIDFVVYRIPDGSGGTTFTRQIRFYGLPRDVDGDGVISGPASTSAVNFPEFGGNSTRFLATPDVRPLADFSPNVNLGYPFERRMPGRLTGSNVNVQPTNRNQIEDYLTTTSPNVPQSFDIREGDAEYLVAWGPGDFDGTALHYTDPASPYVDFAGGKFGPALIRVVVEAYDRQQKLDAPVRTELVFRVPAN